MIAKYTYILYDISYENMTKRALLLVTTRLGFIHNFVLSMSELLIIMAVVISSKGQKTFYCLRVLPSLNATPRKCNQTIHMSKYLLSADGINHALSCPAYQSTTQSSSFAAGKAVDRNEATMSHTQVGDYNPWWKVELAFPIRVTHVVITNREVAGK